MSARSIVISEPELRRLRALLRALLRAQEESDARDHEHLEDLRAELERAVVVEAEQIPAGVVTMHAKIWIEDVLTGVSSIYTLVYPWEADVAAGRISVLAPLGTALLGYRQGDELEWQMPGGRRRLRIQKVLRVTSDAPVSRHAPRHPMPA